MTKRKSNHQRGMTLTELAVVLGVAGLVVAGIWATATSISENQLIDAEMKDLLAISSSIRHLYQGRNFTEPPATEITEALKSADALPRDLRVSATGKILNREGGVIKIWTHSNSPAASSNIVEIEFFNTPKSCKKLLYKMSNIRGNTAPVYIFDDRNGWQLPRNRSPEDFAGCRYASFAFSLN